MLLLMLTLDSGNYILKYVSFCTVLTVVILYGIYFISNTILFIYEKIVHKKEK